MKSAYLYVRVSTDEQKKKGYSLPEQEDRLLRHCEFNNIEVKGIYREDYSAKNFNRPQWIKLLTLLKSRKLKEPENVLFIKWDRFSRNIEYAYQMIGILRSVSVQAMAIDQPIDFSIPESTVMLAVYLSIPEAENGRRALNTSGGMRRARKEGRWMGAAPKGYKNYVNPEGRKYIAPIQPDASLMKWSFEQLSEGHFAAEQIRKMACAQGLKCGRNNFWKLIRNPMYCGIIVVPPYDNEEMLFVKAQHEALISEKLFYEVQDILNGNKRKPLAPKIVSIDMLPLRGFLKCPACGRMLTGSTSKGKYYRYYYYHCLGGVCKCRFKAEDLNEAFEEEIKKYNLAPGAGELFKMVVMDEFNLSNRESRDERGMICKEIEGQELLISKGRKKIMNDEIDADDFKIIKDECNEKLRKLEARLADLPAKSSELRSIEGLLDCLVGKFTNVLQYYRNGDIEAKRHLISSMYPQNLCFDKNGYRTFYLSEPLRLILLINSRLEGIKKGEKLRFCDFSPKVAEDLQRLNFFEGDLGLAAAINDDTWVTK